MRTYLPPYMHHYLLMYTLNAVNILHSKNDYAYICRKCMTYLFVKIVGLYIYIYRPTIYNFIRIGVCIYCVTLHEQDLSRMGIGHNLMFVIGLFFKRDFH